MTDSPFRIPRIPLAQRTSHATTSTAVEEYRSSSPPLGLDFKWKTPLFAELGKKSSTREESEDEVEGESSQLPPLPPLTWRRPIIAAVPDAILPEEEPEETGLTIDAPQVDVQEVPPRSSLVNDLDNDEGTYELESALLDEEEYSILEYCRHRRTIGLDSWDGRFGLEDHPFVKEEEGQVGLVCGSILEVAGTPGSGKTSLLIQMAVRERLYGLCREKERSKGKQRQEGGEEDDWMKLGQRAPQILLIDTEGGIGIDRIVFIARRQIQQLDPVFLDQTLVMSSPALLRSVLAGIQYCRCTSDVELLALFQTLWPSTKRHSSNSAQDGESKMQFAPRLPMRTTMILIDTMSYHMRAPLADEARHLRNQRNLLIYELKQFAERCRRRGVNLVLANQMGFTIVNKEGATTTLSDKDGEGRLIPLLRNQSESILGLNEWRLLLFRAGRHHDRACNRFAYFLGQPVLISPGGEPQVLRSDWLPFAVDQGGIMESTRI